MKVDLTGGAYSARSVIAGAQRSLNLYIQATPQDQGEPAPAVHLPTPGLTLLSDGTNANALGMAYGPASALTCTLNKPLHAALTPQSVLVGDL